MLSRLAMFPISDLFKAANVVTMVVLEPTLSAFKPHQTCRPADRADRSSHTVTRGRRDVALLALHDACRRADDAKRVVVPASFPVSPRSVKTLHPAHSVKLTTPAIPTYSGHYANLSHRHPTKSIQQTPPHLASSPIQPITLAGRFIQSGHASAHWVASLQVLLTANQGL